MLTLSQKANNFTVLLNRAAEKRDCVFIVDSGEGNELETDTMLFENVSGWLVPADMVDEFLASTERHVNKWNSLFVFAEWRQSNEDIVIDFKRYPAYHDQQTA